MNDTQENKLTRFRTISAVLANHAAEFASVPALVAARAALDATIALIGELAQAQQTPTGGIVADKTNLQNQMIETALRVAGAVKALASVQHAETTKGKADITRTTFTRARDDMRDDIAQGIHDLAQSRLVDLADYGITAATLTGFQTRIDAYILAIAKPATAKGERATATSLLDQEIRRGDSIVADRLDGLVEQFRDSGTTFYSDYQNARKTVNTGSRSAPESSPPPVP